VLLLFGEPVLPLYVLAVIVACAAGLASWAQTILLALRKRGQVLGLTVITYILRPVVAVIAMLSFGFSADVVLWAFVVVQLLTLPMAQILTRRALDGLPEEPSGPTAKDPVDDYRATFIRYGVYFLAAGVLVALILQGDRWLIKSNLGLAELGLYGAILTIASVTTNLVFSFMSQLMTPVIFQKFGSSHGDAREGKQAYRTYILLSAGIFFVALAMITLLREPVILLLTDRTFLAAAGLLPILTAAQAIEKLGQSVTLRGLAALRTWPYLWARLIQLLVLLGGGYYGVMTNGIVGVAYAQLAACACYFLVTWSTNWVLLDMPRRDAGAKG
jgi:O-antigen/teichoic acid export membrane protein